MLLFWALGVLLACCFASDGTEYWSTGRETVYGKWYDRSTHKTLYLPMCTVYVTYVRQRYTYRSYMSPRRSSHISGLRSGDGA